MKTYASVVLLCVTAAWVVFTVFIQGSQLPSENNVGSRRSPNGRDADVEKFAREVEERVERTEKRIAMEIVHDLEDLKEKKKNDEKKSRSRVAAAFYVVETAAGSSSPSLLRTALTQLGYRETKRPTDDDVRFVVTEPYAPCAHPTVSAFLNAMSDVSKLVLLCAGDDNFVSHFERKDVIDARLKWVDLKLHDTSKANCLLLEDFYPQTTVVTRSTHVKTTQFASEVLTSRSDAHTILKLSESVAETHVKKSVKSKKEFPLIVRTFPESRLKSGLTKMQKKKKFDSVVAQNYVRNALKRKTNQKFTLRAWAYVVSTKPLIAFYKQGVVHVGAISGSKRVPKEQERAANVTTQQGPYESSESYSCVSSLEAEFGRRHPAVFASYVLPYAKAVARLALRSVLKGERTNSASSASVRAHSHLCFDFLVDDEWKVWLMDFNSKCSTNPGGSRHTSPCKQSMRDALGVDAIETSERFIAEGLEKFDSGAQKLMVLVDERRSDASVFSNFDSSGSVCSRGAFEAQRLRLTKTRKQIQALYPTDGRPRNDASTTSTADAPETTCPVCGYVNSDDSYCERCGHYLQHPEDHDHRGSRKKSDESDLASTFDFVDDEEDVAEHATTSYVTEKYMHCRSSRGEREFALHADAEFSSDFSEPLRTHTLAECCDACAERLDCQAFTFEDSTCSLKFSAGSLTTRPGMVSGASGGARGVSANSHARSGSSREDYFRERLIELYKTHDPSKLERVDSLLLRYKGNEERLLQRTKLQYQ